MLRFNGVGSYLSCYENVPFTLDRVSEVFDLDDEDVHEKVLEWVKKMHRDFPNHIPGLMHL